MRSCLGRLLMDAQCAPPLRLSSQIEKSRGKAWLHLAKRGPMTENAPECKGGGRPPERHTARIRPSPDCPTGRRPWHKRAMPHSGRPFSSPRSARAMGAWGRKVDGCVPATLATLEEYCVPGLAVRREATRMACLRLLAGLVRGALNDQGIARHARIHLSGAGQPGGRHGVGARRRFAGSRARSSARSTRRWGRTCSG